MKNKINKKIELQQKIYETENIDEDKRIDLLENIFILKKQIKEDINDIDKYVEKIYEEILLIDDKFCLITTFVYANQLISEEIMYFANDENNEIIVLKQRKDYQNVSEYKNDLLLFEKNSNENVSFEKIPIKNFLLNLETSKSKPSKKEWSIYIICSIFPLLLVIPLIFDPTSILKTILGAAGLLIKTGTSIFSSITRKVESWVFNKMFKCKNEEKKTKG